MCIFCRKLIAFFSNLLFIFVIGCFLFVIIWYFCTFFIEYFILIFENQRLITSQRLFQFDLNVTYYQGNAHVSIIIQDHILRFTFIYHRLILFPLFWKIDHLAFDSLRLILEDSSLNLLITREHLSLDDTIFCFIY